MFEDRRYDLIVIGAGSGGIGAALSAGRLGLKVLLIEKAKEIGGNAAVSGVTVWEMGVGGTGIPFDIYKELRKEQEAVGIYKFSRHCTWKDDNGKSQFPAGADLIIDNNLEYIDSLLRHGTNSLAENEEFVREKWHGVVFEPKIYQSIVTELIHKTGNISVLTNVSFDGVEFKDGFVKSISLSNGNKVTASYFIDSTDSGVLCQKCGFNSMYGQESKYEFNEPDAPIRPTDVINGVTLIYRICPIDKPGIQLMPNDVSSTCWWRDSFPLTSMVQYPNGDYNVNMLPTMDGKDYANMDKKSAYNECVKRSFAHWHYLQSYYPEFQKYKRISEFVSLGVRETKRIIGEYILTEHDLLKGLDFQRHSDIITIVDHPMDLHGDKRSGCTELSVPYGVPFRCLIPKGSKNLLIASRAASFSSLAASSCRLSRTMMQLGQAAGTAAFLASKTKSEFLELDYQELRKTLQDQNVQLEWPMPLAIENHLTNFKN